MHGDFERSHTCGGRVRGVAQFSIGHLKALADTGGGVPEAEIFGVRSVLVRTCNGLGRSVQALLLNIVAGFAHKGSIDGRPQVATQLWHRIASFASMSRSARRVVKRPAVNRKLAHDLHESSSCRGVGVARHRHFAVGREAAKFRRRCAAGARTARAFLSVAPSAGKCRGGKLSPVRSRKDRGTS